jgi:hypothetical protein
MKTKLWSLPLLAALAFCGCETLKTSGGLLGSILPSDGALTADTIVAGLKEALKVGTDRAVAQVAREGGYAGNALIRIPTPSELEKAAGLMRRIGLGGMVDNFEQKMNMAAEHAARQAAPVFWDALVSMSFQDAKGILQGDNSAATAYFKGKTQDRLREMYAPIVAQHLNSVGAVRAYNELMDRYAAIPLAQKPEFRVEDYATQKALDGLFTVLAAEETRIRQDPAARTTALLQRVFGAR